MELNLNNSEFNNDFKPTIATINSLFESPYTAHSAIASERQ